MVDLLGVVASHAFELLGGLVEQVPEARAAAEEELHRERNRVDVRRADLRPGVLVFDRAYHLDGEASERGSGRVDVDHSRLPRFRHKPMMTLGPSSSAVARMWSSTTAGRWRSETMPSTHSSPLAHVETRTPRVQSGAGRRTEGAWAPLSHARTERSTLAEGFELRNAAFSGA